MPLYPPALPTSGGTIMGNLAVTGTTNLMGTLTRVGENTAAGIGTNTPTFSNGVASQLTNTTRDYMVYLQVGTAGTAFTVAIGPTSTPNHTVINSAAAAAGEIFSVRLPAGWYLEYSITTGTIANQLAVSC